MVDLHVHSTRSDGTLSPKELVDYAITKGLKAFALTDHDTVDGLFEAISYAEELRKTNDAVPEVIPGIEFSTEYEGKEVHIVGLFIDYKSDVFKEYLDEFVRTREERNVKMCRALTEAGMPIDYEEMKAAFPNSVITRAHMAVYMLNKGYAKSREEIFDRYIGDNCPFYIKREHITPMKAIQLILKAEGIPVFAHPILCHLGKEKLSSFVSEFKAAGLIAIEGLYSTYDKKDEHTIKDIAKKYHLLLSGGSDFHGANKKNIDLGIGQGKLKIPDSILADIKARRKNLLFTDMDGTLLLSDSTISEKMRDAIQRMCEAGHKIIMTSGRPLPSIKERVVNLGLNFPGTYIISNNGGCIYDMDNSKVLLSRKVSPEIIKTVTDICNKHGVHVHCYTESEIVGFEEDEELVYYRKRNHMPFILTDDIAGFLKDGSFKIQIISLDNKDLLERVKEEILSILSDEVDTCFSNDRYLEILPKGINKGSGLKFLENYLAYPHSHTFASGDENNDIPMISAAAHGIAMANASEEVKNAAEIVTDRDNNHDGLLDIIDKYFI